MNYKKNNDCFDEVGGGDGERGFSLPIKGSKSSMPPVNPPKKEANLSACKKEKKKNK